MEGGHSCPPGQWGGKAWNLWCFLFNTSLAPRQECRGSLDRGDGFEVKDWGPRLIGFFEIEGEVERPVIKVIWVNERLVDREAVFG